MLPVLLLYVGALLGELDFTEQTENAAWALLFGLLLALNLTGIAGLIASWSTRRGFAVVATIAVLLIGNGIVTAIMGIAEDEGRPRVGEVAGLFSPYSLYRGSITAFADGTSLAPPTGAGCRPPTSSCSSPSRRLPGRHSSGATAGSPRS